MCAGMTSICEGVTSTGARGEPYPLQKHSLDAVAVGLVDEVLLPVVARQVVAQLITIQGLENQ